MTETTECSECGSSKNGVEIESSFLCFACMKLSREDDIWPVSKDEFGWWMQRIQNGKWNKWARVSIEDNDVYDKAIEAYIAKLIVT